jgi:hypothetical protein
MVYSWYLSYPLSINSVDDFVFNHVSILYWISLSLVLASMFMIAVTFKNDYLKWIMTAGIIITMYSISYFYFRLPSSDSLYYRGLHEYFSRTENIDFTQPGKTYFQWPSVFILTDIVTSLSGIELANFEFLMFAVLGFLLATTLYIYVSKTYRNGAFISVIVFFMAMKWYLNYQFAAFTIALVLLFLMFILDSRRKSLGVIVTMLVLFVGMTITHAYTPLFFVAYLLIRYFINRSKQYGKLFLLFLSLWLLFQVNYATFGFAGYIWKITNRSTEVSLSKMATVKPVSVPIDAVAQNISIAIVIISVAICIAGFTFLLFKRKLRDIDKAIFVIGGAYFGLGILLFILGSRAIPIAFVPVSLGVAYLFENRFRPYLIILFLVLLILFPVHPLHSAFFNNDVMFQTQESYIATNFLIDNYNWTSRHFIYTNYRTRDYIVTKLAVNTHITWKFEEVNKTDTIFYTVGLGLYLSRHNYTIGKMISEERLNVKYNNGFSILVTKVDN